MLTKIVHKNSSPKIKIGFVQAHRCFLQLSQMNVYWDSLFQNYRWSKTNTQNRISHVAWGEFILPTKQFLFQCVKYQGWVLWADCFLLLSFLYADLGRYFQLLLDFCCIFCSSSRQEGFGGLSCKGLSHWILFSGRSALHWPQQGPNPSTGFSWSWLFQPEQDCTWD